MSLLPIWNWDRVVETNDVRYLMILDDYNKLPNVHKYAKRDLMVCYADMVKQFDVSNNAVIKAKKRVMVRVIDIILEIVNTSKDINKIRLASTILRGLLIDSSQESFLWNVDFLETPDQKQLLTHLAIEIKKYNAKVATYKKREKQSLEAQVARINSGLGVNIDPHKCSVLQYLAYSKEYAAKYNLLQRQLN